MMKIQMNCWSGCVVLAVIGCLSVCQIRGEEATPDKAVVEASVGTEAPQEIEWMTDYAEAYDLAKLHNKMLLIYFEGKGSNSACKQFEQVSLKDEMVQAQLHEFVTARIPTDTEIMVQGKPIKLLEHGSFVELKRAPGLAMLDFVHHDTEHFGHVVSVVPFTAGKYYQFRPDHLRVLLDLPSGTITQRTLMFAVRIHPEKPASTKGDKDPVLMAEANSHSKYQADIGVQGHHNWDHRFQRIQAHAKGSSSPTEVVAESWPNQTLVDSAVDCVHSWRQSPGHWSAVHARHQRFGYDMRLGSNGIWYATGIFGRRH